MKANHYDSFAESYSTDNESNLLNAYYERPAMIACRGRQQSPSASMLGAVLGPCPQRYGRRVPS